jgi:sialate O-acetylesterase
MPAFAIFDVAIDVGELSVHPRDKRSVGERLARVALAKTYGQSIEFSGPTFRGMRVVGDEVRLSFDHADGMRAKGDALKGFAIAGPDQKFAWAEARVEGGEVVLRSAAVAKPVAVRYGWADNPACNLTNASGLPAVPFRTDDWPMTAIAEKDAK